jgi:hypothetical protein
MPEKEEETTCLICLDDGGVDLASEINCRCTQMIVHRECLLKWLAEKTDDGLSICPVCRSVAGWALSSRIEGPDGNILGLPLPPNTIVTFSRYSGVKQQTLYSATVNSSHPSIEKWHTAFAATPEHWSEETLVNFDTEREVVFTTPKGGEIPAWNLIAARFMLSHN